MAGATSDGTVGAHWRALSYDAINGGDPNGEKPSLADLMHDACKYEFDACHDVSGTTQTRQQQKRERRQQGKDAMQTTIQADSDGDG